MPYLESCIWPDAFSQWTRQRYRIKFYSDLGKYATETLAMIRQEFGEENMWKLDSTTPYLHSYFHSRTSLYGHGPFLFDSNKLGYPTFTFILRPICHATCSFYHSDAVNGDCSIYQNTGMSPSYNCSTPLKIKAKFLV
jgi:hypothetical protein